MKFFYIPRSKIMQKNIQILYKKFNYLNNKKKNIKKLKKN